MLILYVFVCVYGGSVVSRFQSDLVILLFGIFLLCLSIYWTASGKIWKPRSVSLTRKADSPFDYWFGVIVYYLAALTLIVYSIQRIAN